MSAPAKRVRGHRVAALVIVLAAMAMGSGGCGRSVEHARIVSLRGANGQTAYYRVVVRARGKAALRVGSYDARAIDAVLGGAPSRKRRAHARGRRGKQQRNTRTVVIYSRAAAAIEQAIEAAANEIAARQAVERATRAMGQRRRARQHRVRARWRRARRLVAEVRRALRLLSNISDKRARAAALRRLLEDLAALPLDRRRHTGAR